MKALTIWQPWASLIMIGAKPYEFRKWDFATRVPEITDERIVIHAGARPVRRAEVLDLIDRMKSGESSLVDSVARPLLDRLLEAHKCQGVLPLACGLGTAKIGKAARAVDLFGHRVSDSSRIDHQMWAWPLSEIDHWQEPVDCRGFQGFWNWPLPLPRAA